MSHSNVYEFEATDIEGNPVPLSKYQGQVSLIVNVASKCGFTPQYEGLEKLQQDLHEQGFNVLAFPSNEFGKQEPGSSDEIAEFCALNYNISLPLFEKIEVNGPNAHPLYKFIKEQKAGLLNSKAIKWNFTKFLVDRSGRVVKRYAPQTKPEAIRKDIEELL